MKVDTSRWAEFQVGTLFDCETTKGIPSKNNLLEGSIAYITRSAENNGLSGFCGNESHRNNGNCITIGAEGFTAFWQDDDFVAGNKVYAIRHKRMNRESGLFICSALNTLSDRYSFKEARVLDKIKEEVIKLPSRVTVDFSTVERIGGGVEMSKIDTSSWNEFRLGDLFEIIRGSSKLMRNLNEGNTPIIAAARSNNGVAMYADVEPEYENAITVSCNGVGCGSTFYQKGPFAMNGDAAVLIEKEPLSENAKLGLTAILDSILSNKYSYEDKCSPEKLMDETILLPGIEEPDWEYMESYMASVMGGCRTQFESLLKFADEPHKVDVSKWGEFRVGDYFEIFHGVRLTKSKREEGNIPLLTAGYENQGVAEYINNPEMPRYRNPITVDMFGNCFYHDGIYTGDDNIYFFINDDVSHYARLFLSSIIMSALQGHYDYGRQFRQGDADSLKVILPVTSSCEPDWQYMEEFMQTVIDKQTNTIQNFSHIMRY